MIYNSKTLDSKSARPTRRHALMLFGAGAAALSQRLVLASKAPPFPKGAVIRTVLKDISPGLITGETLFHEHLSVAYSRTERQLKLPPPSTSDIGPVVEDVKEAAKVGVTCIVDGGHPDMGRNMEQLRQIAEETGVYIVGSTGFYMENNYPAEIATMSEDQIADELVRQANEEWLGAFGEIGQSNNTSELTPQEHKVFRAVGRSHLRTNLPIFTHNAYGTGPNVPKNAGLLQLDVLESVGVKPQHVAIGHMDSLDDPTAEIIKQIAKRGAFVGFDRVTSARPSDDQQVTEVLALLEAGYADKLFLSSDKRRGFVATPTAFVPKLRAAGVSDDVLHTILVDNPRRFLAVVPKTPRKRQA
jgi:phosphotriesterase-related protein